MRETSETIKDYLNIYFCFWCHSLYLLKHRYRFLRIYLKYNFKEIVFFYIIAFFWYNFTKKYMKCYILRVNYQISYENRVCFLVSMPITIATWTWTSKLICLKYKLKEDTFLNWMTIFTYFLLELLGKIYGVLSIMRDLWKVVCFLVLCLLLFQCGDGHRSLFL